jgi:PP-loop superfamily ATP-utilizing enzyme
MKQNIESEMTAMGCKTWAQMKAIMRNHNRHKQEQERKWETLTKLEQHEYAVKNLAILKLRSDWQKGFVLLKTDFLL